MCRAGDVGPRPAGRHRPQRWPPPLSPDCVRGGCFRADRCRIRPGVRRRERQRCYVRAWPFPPLRWRGLHRESLARDSGFSSAVRIESLSSVIRTCILVRPPGRVKAPSVVARDQCCSAGQSGGHRHRRSDHSCKPEAFNRGRRERTVGGTTLVVSVMKLRKLAWQTEPPRLARLAARLARGTADWLNQHARAGGGL